MSQSQDARRSNYSISNNSQDQTIIVGSISSSASPPPPPPPPPSPPPSPPPPPTPHQFSTKKVTKKSEINTKQAFQLIDYLLPFEACLFHQILPLDVKDGALKVGMVNTEDTSVLDYVSPIIKSLHYSLKKQPISAQLHQDILSAYLNQGNSAKQNKKPIQQNKPEKSLPVYSPQKSSKPEQSLPVYSSQKSSKSAQSLPTLKVQAHYLSCPIEFFTTLKPQELLPELLGRVLAGGIKRLYFERHQTSGRIILSKDGVLQSVLKDLEVSVFQGTINELKQMASLPVKPLSKIKKIEMLRSYKKETVLIRYRFIPGKYGEEATLQILRGKALKFYQQQQMDKLGQEVLQLAQKLERKLKQLSARSHFNSASIENLPDIDKHIKNLNKQMESIKK